MVKEDHVKLVVFDVNGTLINENSWLKLNLAMGVMKEEDKMLMDWFYEDEIISYAEGQKILERIYKRRGDATYNKIKEVLYDYTYLEGAKDIIKYLQAEDYEVALISGSMDILLDKIAEDLDIEMYEANNIFIFDENDFLEEIHCLGTDRDVKYSHLLSFCRRLNITPEQCVCVGDGHSDTLLFEKTGKGITYKGSGIEEHAWKVINDLNELKQVL